jgi:hypothetical protein
MGRISLKHTKQYTRGDEAKGTCLRRSSKIGDQIKFRCGDATGGPRRFPSILKFLFSQMTPPRTDFPASPGAQPKFGLTTLSLRL